LQGCKEHVFGDGLAGGQMRSLPPRGCIGVGEVSWNERHGLEGGFFEEFADGCLIETLARLDGASDALPEAALYWDAPQEEELVATGHGSDRIDEDS
jgi:hypothetical protein